MESNQEIKQIFNNMMEISGWIVNTSPIYKKDMSDYDKIAVQWKISGVYGYQIFKPDSYTYKIGEMLENPDIYIKIYNRELAKRFLKGEKVEYRFAPRKDYKGKFKLMHFLGFKDVEDRNGPRKRRITEFFLTARIYNEIFQSPYSLFKLPPFQIYYLITKKTEEPEEGEEFGAYIPINQSLGTYENQVIPYAIFKHFIEEASSIAMQDCGCRVVKDCQHHDHSLGCFFMGRDVLKLKLFEALNPQILTKEEALDIVKRAIDDGLIPVIGRLMGGTDDYGVKDEGYILRSCFCCTCCCLNALYATYGPFINTTISRMEGVSVSVDEALCKGSGKCVEICVFRAIEDVDGKAKIDTERCKGCGRCVDVCPNGAITIEIDDISRVNEIIQNIESVVDVRDQASLKH